MNEQENEGRTVPVNEQSKQKDLDAFREDPTGKYMTSDQGVRIEHTDDSLKAGPRGPTLMEDFHFRERITHFDHERIPERVVHARGSAAHGYFQVYQSMAEYTKAAFLQDPSVKTPVFVRFSTVVGSRGSADTVRDVRGFAVKFYTSEGNFDLVGNNIPVFFIQDGIKFPDVVHAAKPEPHHEMPGASTAHDNFWDFASLMPETAHMLMWVLSDRALPRSYRMMEGFGVHTFRLVNARGRSRFVKFHWKPVLGVHSMLLDEALRVAGKDPDFHRRDLWEAIERGDFPEFELGVQIVEEDDEHKFDFDLLDATKIIPEELVPVQRIGKLVLNRNPDNFFAETEQVAFCVSNLVPGIDVTDDPLMQARLFSYLDTQLTRLGGPNFTEIPINRPVCPVHNVNQDGFHRDKIHRGRVNYFPNSLGGGDPHLASEKEGGYKHYPERVEGPKVRQRGEKFKDHFSQATLFYNSLSQAEREHLIEAAQFELGKVEHKAVRQRMIELFERIDPELAREAAVGVGVTPPAGAVGTAVKKAAQAVSGAVSEAVTGKLDRSPSLSQENQPKDSIRTRRIAVLAAPGYSHAELDAVKSALTGAGAWVEVISKHLGTLTSADGGSVEVDRNQITVQSILYDAVYVPGGRASVDALMKEGMALHFLQEAFRHCKPIGATGEGVDLLAAAGIRASTKAGAAGVQSTDGVVSSHDPKQLQAFSGAFVKAIAQHRFWHRAGRDQMPA